MEGRFQNDLHSISELGDAVGRNGRDRVRHEVCLRYTKVRSCYDDNRDGLLFFSNVIPRVAAMYELSKAVYCHGARSRYRDRATPE
jgi:hypothetical protein